MRQFYLMIKKGAPLEHQLTWSHYKILISIKDLNKIYYYINQVITRNLSKRQLQEIIKSNEYERLPNKTKEKLINNEKDEIQDFIKHPIIIRNPNNIVNISEKVLKMLIIEDLDNFLQQLGNGYSYIQNEYKIKIGNIPNYIDKNLKTIYQNNTIGIIIARKENKFVIEYSSDNRIFETTYLLNK